MARKQGTRHGDKFHGTGDNDTYFGLGGNDRIFGNGGNDKLDGGKDDDHIEGGNGNDTLHGQQGEDFLHGGTGNDALFGGSGKDNLKGAAGVDKIVGGAGIDLLSGGAGADDFYFAKGDTGNFTSHTADRIIDFSGAEGDRILIKGISGYDMGVSSLEEGRYGTLGYRDEQGDHYVVAYMLGGVIHEVEVNEAATGHVFGY